MAPSDSRSVNCYGHGHLVCKFTINVTVPSVELIDDKRCRLVYLVRCVQLIEARPAEYEPIIRFVHPRIEGGELLCPIREVVRVPD